jgi:hypothetical protein
VAIIIWCAREDADHHDTLLVDLYYFGDARFSIFGPDYKQRSDTHVHTGGGKSPEGGVNPPGSLAR